MFDVDSKLKEIHTLGRLQYGKAWSGINTTFIDGDLYVTFNDCEFTGDTLEETLNDAIEYLMEV